MPLLNTANLRVGAAIVQNAYFGGVDVALGTPSLDLDFTTGALDPRITVTRASTKTYFDINGVMQTAAANTLPTEYDPVTLAPKGVSVWEARTNLLTYSEQFDNAAWTKNAPVLPNTAVAPTGLMTADKLVEAVATQQHYANSAVVTRSAGVTTQTFTIFAKAAERAFVRVAVGDSTFAAVVAVIFNLSAGSAGAVTTSGGWAATRTITSVGGGWYRCEVICTTDAATTGTQVRVGISNDGVNAVYTGNGTSGVYLWGAQLEAGAFPTPYIPTPATFTSRASTATYFDNAGVMQTAAINAARNGYGLVGGQWISKGLELEAAATNLIVRSEELDNASWVKTRTTVAANAVAAPTGAVTADKLVEDTSVTLSHVAAATNSALAANTLCTFSVFAKAAGRTFLSLRINNGADSVWCGFNLTTGTAGVVVNSGTGNSAVGRVVDVGNGWYRCILSGVPSTTLTNPSATCYLAVSNSDPSNTSIVYTGDGASGVYLWGAQLEAGPIATSYIPTVAATVTRAADISSSATVSRAADVAVMTGANFSDWYNQTAGTFVVQAASQAPGNVSRYLFAVTDGTTNERIHALINTAASPRVLVADGAVTQADLTAGAAVVAGEVFKAAVAVALDSVGISAKGSTVVSDTAATMPTVNQIHLGSDQGPGQRLCGYLARVTYYPKRVSNAGIKELSV